MILVHDGAKTVGAALLVFLASACGNSKAIDDADACASGLDASLGMPRPDCPLDLPDGGACTEASPLYADVAPIIERRCTICHRPGGLQPTKLFQTYDEVYAMRREMLFQIYSCRMPPPCTPDLTADERQTLLNWFVCGAPATVDGGTD